MDAKTATLTADQVLRVFHQSEIFLLLGASFATVGIVSAAISFFGRKFDPLLLWLAIFAFVYGNRLWLQTPLMGLMVPDSVVFPQSVRISQLPRSHSRILLLPHSGIPGSRLQNAGLSADRHHAVPAGGRHSRLSRWLCGTTLPASF
jgi:hypothetical protein